MVLVICRLPGPDRLMGLNMRPPHKAATALDLPGYDRV
jgi:hypothetical protein